MASEEEYLDSLCASLYESGDAETRGRAERQLAEFAESDAAFTKSLLMLERGTTPYAQLVAATTLLGLVSKPNAAAPLTDRHELCKYVVNYLGNRTKLEKFVVGALCRLFARLIKLGWFDFMRTSETEADKSSEFVFRVSVENVIQMVNQKNSMAECAMGVELLVSVVAEMNSQAGLPSISKHRKTAAAFRDAQLYDIFQLAYGFLATASERMDKSMLQDQGQLLLLNQLVDLAQSCLAFDFIGSITDDTSDDNVSIQVPTAWRQAFVNTEIVKLFFGLYSALPNELSSKALGIVVQLCSIRRTIFNNTERQDFLTALVKGTLGVLQAPQGLASAEAYHEFCRLVARLKSNYQLMELTKIPDYQALIGLLADFTVSSFQMKEATSNNLHYLLSFWQRMVSSQPYVKASEPHQLNRYAPAVTKAFVRSRLELIAAALEDSAESPFEDFTSLSQQLEQMGVIGRCEYVETSALLQGAFGVSGAAYASAASSLPSTSADFRLAEGRVTWLVFLVGSAVGGRVAFSSSEDHDLSDGELICKVLTLMRMSDERLASGNGGSEHLEMAFIYFLAQFRKIYISDQVQKTSKVYAKLSGELGLADEAAVLGVFIRKIVNNLKYWASSEKLVEETLGLLNDLSCGFTSARKLVALPEIQFVLQNHTSAEFPFLGTEASMGAMKGRTTFHAALTRLLIIELPENPDSLDRFLTPIQNSLKELTQLFASTSDVAAIRGQEKAKKAVIGLSRDLRGVAQALNTKQSFGRLFDWLYPENLELFAKAMEIWHADSDVTTAILRLGCELCQNRSQRLHFDVSSPNAILLFKEASKLIQAYGRGILRLGEVGKGEDVWRSRLKGISIAIGLLKAALSGSYVNFGVFRLYGDTCLEDALNIFVQLVTAIPRQDILAYGKLSQNYYFLVEALSSDHMPYLSHLSPSVFAFLLHSLRDGLSALDTIIVTTSCSTLDNVASYLFRRLKSASNGPTHRHIGMAPEGDNCILAVKEDPSLLTKMLSAMVSSVMFEECRCQWSISRPLLVLILLLPEQFAALETSLVESQPAQFQAAIARSFVALMEEVDSASVGIKNKDKFTQNLSVFRREVTECLKGESGSTGAAPPLNGASSRSDMMC